MEMGYGNGITVSHPLEGSLEKTWDQAWKDWKSLVSSGAFEVTPALEDQERVWKCVNLSRVYYYKIVKESK